MRLTRYGSLSLVYQHTPKLSYVAEVPYGMRDNQGGERNEAPRVQLNLTYRFLHENRKQNRQHGKGGVCASPCLGSYYSLVESCVAVAS